jgi:predicted Ser/Thr protein kinase
MEISATIQVMMDKNIARRAITVRHQGHDGQKWSKKSSLLSVIHRPHSFSSTHFLFTRFMPLRFWPTSNLLNKKWNLRTVRRSIVDTKYLKKCMKEIKVTNLENEDVEVVNDSPLEMIGKGRQGAVFRLSDDICVKVFGNQEDCEREYYALSLGQQSDLFPRLYAKGDLYIAMEIIKGVDVREYLQSQPLSEELSLKLIEMLITFKEIGYDRIDHHKRQIYLQPDGSLKVIDVARAVWRDRVYPYPRKLMTSLGEKNKKVFLSHVQSLKPELYEEWKYYIEMEDLSREIYYLLLEEEPDKEKLRELSDRLLTTSDKKVHLRQLENMMHKVFKEEWVKTMLARGEDPDAVMDKIDEYWEGREMGLDPKKARKLKVKSKKPRQVDLSSFFNKSAEKTNTLTADPSWDKIMKSLDKKKKKKKRKK